MPGRPWRQGGHVSEPALGSSARGRAGRKAAPRVGRAAGVRERCEGSGGGSRKRGGGRNGVCQSPSGGGGEEFPAPADLTNAGAVPNRPGARNEPKIPSAGPTANLPVERLTTLENFGHSLKAQSYLYRPASVEQIAEVFRTAKKNGLTVAQRGERCARRANQTISANTAPTATMAMTVAIRALGRVSIMRGFERWLPGTGSNRRPSD